MNYTYETCWSIIVFYIYKYTLGELFSALLNTHRVRTVLKKIHVDYNVDKYTFIPLTRQRSTYAYSVYGTVLTV